MRAVRVLFVCIGNSCRSPMAEGFARHKHGHIIEAASAGVTPAAIIQPETYQVMGEKGISLEGISPSELGPVEAAEIDYVVNISGYAMLHRLPGFEGRNIVWNVHDPIGKPIEIYRQVRDRIEQLVDELAARLEVVSVD